MWTVKRYVLIFTVIMLLSIVIGVVAIATGWVQVQRIRLKSDEVASVTVAEYRSRTETEITDRATVEEFVRRVNSFGIMLGAWSQKYGWTHGVTFTDTNGEVILELQILSSGELRIGEFLFYPDLYGLMESIYKVYPK